jgi:hypothetical protein
VNVTVWLHIFGKLIADETEKWGKVRALRVDALRGAAGPPDGR